MSTNTNITVTTNERKEGITMSTITKKEHNTLVMDVVGSLRRLAIAMNDHDVYKFSNNNTELLYRFEQLVLAYGVEDVDTIKLGMTALYAALTFKKPKGEDHRSFTVAADSTFRKHLRDAVFPIMNLTFGSIVAPAKPKTKKAPEETLRPMTEAEKRQCILTSIRRCEGFESVTLDDLATVLSLVRDQKAA